MHKRIVKNSSTLGSKNRLSVNLEAKTNFNTKLSKSPKAQFTKRPESQRSDV